jgi:hypothetical protein
MSYLDEISVAVSPYVARVNKAIEFYKANKNKLDTTGLFLAIGNGPSAGWDGESTGNDIVPLPSLDTYEIQNVKLFKRYRNMWFVKSDVDGKLNVGDMTWAKIDMGNSDEEYYLNAINAGARWIYVDFEVKPTELVDGYIRQVGIYSNLKLSTSADKTQTAFTSSDMIQMDSGKRKYNGILELYQNKEAYVKSSEIKEIYAYVLEF